MSEKCDGVEIEGKCVKGAKLFDKEKGCDVDETKVGKYCVSADAKVVTDKGDKPARNEP